MCSSDLLRNQLADVETRLGQAAPEQFDDLNNQRMDLQRRIDARAALIEEQGGAAIPQEQFQQATAAKMQALDSQIEKLNANYAAALENKDYDAAAETKNHLLYAKKYREDFTNKTAQQMQALQEKQAGLEQRGQTRELFAEMPEQPEAQGLKYERTVSKLDKKGNVVGFKQEEMPTPGVAESIEDVFQLPRPTLREKQTQQAATKKAEAENNLAAAVRSGSQVQIGRAHV